MTLHRSATAIAALLLAAPAAAETEIQFWHAMGGALGEKVEEIARMLGGKALTKQTLAHASEMFQAAQSS